MIHLGLRSFPVQKLRKTQKCAIRPLGHILLFKNLTSNSVQNHLVGPGCFLEGTLSSQTKQCSFLR